MLDTGTAPRQIAGLTVFEDHADPRVRYVLADAPRVLADPEPRVSLLLFRGAQEGALLQLHTELRPTEAQLEGVREALRAEAIVRPTLRRPDWQGGRVRLAGWLAEEDALEPLVLEIGTPSRLGDPMALVSARLDRHAATLAERALRGGGLPTVVLYELELLGLEGPLGIEAEADLQAIHERLTARGALTTPYGAAELSATWESLLSERLIRLTVVDESGDVEGRRAEALRRVGQSIVATMFSAMPPPEAASRLTDEAIAAVELSFRLTRRREALQTTARWSFRERQARRIVHHAAASLGSMLGGRPAEPHVSFVDLSPQARALVVRSDTELEPLGISALEVDLRVGERELGAVLQPGVLEARLPLDEDAPRVEYRVRARFDPTRTRAEERQSSWQTAPGMVVMVSPQRLFPPRTQVVVGGDLEWSWLDHVEVVLEAPGESPRSLVLTDERRSAEATFPGAGDGAIAMTVHYRGRAGEPSRSDPRRELPPQESLTVIDGPFGASIDVLVVPLPLPGVVSLVVELEGEDEGLTQVRTASWEGDDRAPVERSLRRLRGASRHYWHRTTVVYADGRVEQGAWARSGSGTLVVGADEPMRVDRTRVVVLGGGAAGWGVAAIELELQAGDRSVRALLEGTDDEAVLTLVSPVDAPPPGLLVHARPAEGLPTTRAIPEPGPIAVVEAPLATDPPPPGEG